VQSDGSFFLRITSLLPGDYKLALNTSSSTTGISGWGKSGVDVKIEAGKVTQVTVTLERMTTFAILGYFDAELAEDEDWSSFEAFLVDTAGNNYTAVLAKNDEEEWTINGYNITVESIIEALKITGNDIETMMFPVDVTNTAFENGYSLFDIIDKEAMLVLTPDTGTLDVTIPPIDLGEDEEGEVEGETEGEGEIEGEGEVEDGSLPLVAGKATVGLIIETDGSVTMLADANEGFSLPLSFYGLPASIASLGVEVYYLDDAHDPDGAWEDRQVVACSGLPFEATVNIFDSPVWRFQVVANSVDMWAGNYANSVKFHVVVKYRDAENWTTLSQSDDGSGNMAYQVDTRTL